MGQDALDWPALFTFVSQTTAAVGAQLVARQGAMVAEVKGDGSLVTAADRWADQAVCEAIRAAFPDHGLLTEEGGQIAPDQDWVWVVDPIDGTTNYSQGLPIWGISLALLHFGRPVLGHVHLPALNWVFQGLSWADQRLATLNGRPLRPNPGPVDEHHLFSFCSRSLRLWRPAFPCKVRMVGAASYNLLSVAQGVCVGAVEATPKVWDLAAVWVIAQAAGACWVSLSETDPFPLQTGRDYGQVSFPTLLVGRPEWVSVFKPWMDVSPLALPFTQVEANLPQTTATQT